MEVINQKEDEDHAIEDNDNAVDTEDGALYGEEENEEEEDALENEEEEEGDSDTVDEDQFKFCGGVNSMDFVRKNDLGVQLYQKFEDYHQKSIEYRALDNRKRKPPQQPHREETSSKKARKDDISGVGLADMEEELMNLGQRKRSKKI